MDDRGKLRLMSLLAAVFFSLHWADEIARGLEPGTFAGLWGGLLILGTWLTMTIVFADRRWGVVILLLGSIVASGVPILHSMGRGLVLGRYGTGSVLLFWVWNNIALGVSGLVSLVLAVRVLVATRTRSRTPL